MCLLTLAVTGRPLAGCRIRAGATASRAVLVAYRGDELDEQRPDLMAAAVLALGCRPGGCGRWQVAVLKTDRPAAGQPTVNSEG